MYVLHMQMAWKRLIYLLSNLTKFPSLRSALKAMSFIMAIKCFHCPFICIKLIVHNDLYQYSMYNLHDLRCHMSNAICCTEVSNAVRKIRHTVELLFIQVRINVSDTNM